MFDSAQRRDCNRFCAMVDSRRTYFAACHAEALRRRVQSAEARA